MKIIAVLAITYNIFACIFADGYLPIEPDYTDYEEILYKKYKSPEIDYYELSTADNSDLLPEGLKNVPGRLKNAPPSSSMMDTFEKLKRQAETINVPGDEPKKLTKFKSINSHIANAFNWQITTIISILCVAAVMIGIILGVIYYSRQSVNECEDSKSFLRGGSATENRSKDDKFLAHSAQMYHYQQHKQQMLAMDKEAVKNANLTSEEDSEIDADEPGVNVFECPGLATTGKLEVLNPLFEDQNSRKQEQTITSDDKK